MKDSAEYAARFKKLVNRLKRAGLNVRDYEKTGAVEELVLAALAAHNTEAKSRSAFNKLRNFFVDFNEIRVTRPDELVEIIGKNYPHAKEAAVQITQMLGAVYLSQDVLDLKNLNDAAKRDAKNFLAELPGASPYIIARVMLHSLGGHAIPVNNAMLEMLRGEQVVDHAAALAEVQGFLERQISSTGALKTWAMLQAHADEYKPAKPEPAAETAEPAKKKPSAKTRKAAAATAAPENAKQEAEATEPVAKKQK